MARVVQAPLVQLLGSLVSLSLDDGKLAVKRDGRSCELGCLVRQTGDRTSAASRDSQTEAVPNASSSQQFPDSIPLRCVSSVL